MHLIIKQSNLLLLYCSITSIDIITSKLSYFFFHVFDFFFRNWQDGRPIWVYNAIEINGVCLSPKVSGFNSEKTQTISNKTLSLEKVKQLTDHYLHQADHRRRDPTLFLWPHIHIDQCQRICGKSTDRYIQDTPLQLDRIKQKS